MSTLEFILLCMLIVSSFLNYILAKQVIVLMDRLYEETKRNTQKL